MRRSCETCERRVKAPGKAIKCKVFKSKPSECWAWTDDPAWEEKVNQAVAEYTGRKAKRVS